MGSKVSRDFLETLVLRGLGVTLDRQAARDKAAKGVLPEVRAAKGSLDSRAVLGLPAFREPLVQVETPELQAALDSQDRLDDREVQDFRARLAGVEIRDRLVHLDLRDLWDLQVQLDFLVTQVPWDLLAHLVRKELLEVLVSVKYCLAVFACKSKLNFSIHLSICLWVSYVVVN